MSPGHRKQLATFGEDGTASSGALKTDKTFLGRAAGWATAKRAHCTLPGTPQPPAHPPTPFLGLKVWRQAIFNIDGNRQPAPVIRFAQCREHHPIAP